MSFYHSPTLGTTNRHNVSLHWLIASTVAGTAGGLIATTLRDSPVQMVVVMLVIAASQCLVLLALAQGQWSTAPRQRIVAPLLAITLLSDLLLVFLYPVILWFAARIPDYDVWIPIVTDLAYAWLVPLLIWQVIGVVLVAVDVARRAEGQPREPFRMKHIACALFVCSLMGEIAVVSTESSIASGVLAGLANGIVPAMLIAWRGIVWSANPTGGRGVSIGRAE